MRKFLLLLPLILFFAGNVVAGVAPPKVIGATTVDTMFAKKLLDKGVTFVDVSSEKEYQAGHIPGAKHLNIDNLTSETLSAIVAKNKPVAFYCAGKICSTSSVATKQALEWGWTKVFYYRAGLSAWKRSGLELKK